ncbi:hypothetical protein T459_32530 [Capsicum annuum]|uniref:Disease resistance R13L4/SHOC-2-like LRR domain-containing protein n=1 Tax=Capsicum annuum TaxID=4072 RepID=A0A2G2Y1H3_CAPAN|nr:hypothetical protein T459_32530 [Capsicum annuum]
MVDCVFIGYVKSCKACRFLVHKSEHLDINENMVIESDNAKFFENIYSYKLRHEQSSGGSKQPGDESIENKHNKENPRCSTRQRMSTSFGLDFVTFLLENEPQTFKEAMASSNLSFWKQAVNSEIDSILSNHTWELVDFPPRNKPLGSKWIFKRKMKMDGEIPKEISNLVELEELDLADNSFSGQLDMEIFNISGLRIIDLTDNNISGSLPPNIGCILPNIEELYLNDLTNLVGTIPHSISNCSKLTILDLAGNKLTSLIPKSLGYLTHLQILILEEKNLTSDSSFSFLSSLTSCRNLTLLVRSFNPLNGVLPASMGNLSTSLRTFVANSCKIQGRIPNEVGNLSSLLFLYLSGNNLVGSIPTSIGNLRNLQRFDLTNNKLSGFIGDYICKLQHLGDIYFGHNHLSGSLPYCLGNITSLREIHLGSNKLSSNIPPSLVNLQDLVVLDLSSKDMVGSLPPEIGNLKDVTLIDVAVNQFSNCKLWGTYL